LNEEVYTKTPPGISSSHPNAVILDFYFILFQKLVKNMFYFTKLILTIDILVKVVNVGWY